MMPYILYGWSPRHPDLAPFLLEKLKACQLKEINSSLVPILSMLSRVSPGLQSQDDQGE